MTITCLVITSRCLYSFFNSLFCFPLEHWKFTLQSYLFYVDNVPKLTSSSWHVVNRISNHTLIILFSPETLKIATNTSSGISIIHSMCFVNFTNAAYSLLPLLSFQRLENFIKAYTLLKFVFNFYHIYILL
jgi:hypothetical protein